MAFREEAIHGGFDVAKFSWTTRKRMGAVDSLHCVGTGAGGTATGRRAAVSGGVAAGGLADSADAVAVVFCGVSGPRKPGVCGGEYAARPGVQQCAVWRGCGVVFLWGFDCAGAEQFIAGTCWERGERLRP